MGGGVVVPVFTSVDGLTRCLERVGPSLDGEFAGYLTVAFPALGQNWPDPAWRLAVNPGTPIDAVVEVDLVERAARGEVTVPSGAGPSGAGPAAGDPENAAGPGFVPANPSELSIALGLRAGDENLVLDGLLAATVQVPTTRPVTAGDIEQADFPWRSTAGPPPAIEVFTSAERMSQALPGPPPAVPLRFVDVVLAWPGDPYRLAVNPGSPLAVMFDSAQISDLLGRIVEQAMQVDDVPTQGGRVGPVPDTPGAGADRKTTGSQPPDDR
jgi:hypothetical protein